MYTFSELVNVSVIQEMAVKLYKMAGIPIGIIDTEGNIQVQAGWQVICMKYHRTNTETCKRCQESDRYIDAHLHEGPYVEYKCLNNLWDVAIPIVFTGHHIATLFVGQFFYDDEVIDDDYFEKQAVEFGFNVKEYMDALKRVPVFSRERIRDIMSYYKSYVEFLVEDGMRKIENDTMNACLTESEALFKGIFENAPIAICTQSISGNFMTMNAEFCKMMGYSKEELMQLSFDQITYEEDLVISKSFVKKLLNRKIGKFELNKRYVTKRGKIIHGLVNVSLVCNADDDPLYFLVIIRDVTAQKKEMVSKH